MRCMYEIKYHNFNCTGFKMQLRPSDIYFSQDSIRNRFRDGCLHSNKTLGETLDDLCEGRISVCDIPVIAVTQKDGKWFTGDNRRLWVFRHLERLGKCTFLTVYEGYISSDKFTTYNGGASVRVRGYPGGRWYSKPDVITSIQTQRNRPQHQSKPVFSRFNRRPEDTSTRAVVQNFDNLFLSGRQTYSDPPTSNYIYRPSSSSSRRYDLQSRGSYDLQSRGSYDLQSRGSNYQLSSSSLSFSNSRFDGNTTVFNSGGVSSPLSAGNSRFVDPENCRFIKESIRSCFDDGRSYSTLKENLVRGFLSYREVPAVKAYNAYDVYYVSDGNRRLKAFQEAKRDDDEIDDLKIKVEVIGDEDDLLDELRRVDPAITAFEVMLLGETVDICN